MALGERVRRRREFLGWSQQDLANQTGMPQTIISRIERGVNKNPGADVLKRLATALRCSTDWLLEMYDDAPDDISARLLAGASP
jgi:transcriptional regulator with XRE-family HTH domain